MAQKFLQVLGGGLSAESLSAAESNFDDLYAYYGVAAGNPFATNRFVDGDNGADSNDGKTPTRAFKTIQAAINASAQGDRIFIKSLEADTASGDTDPDSYAECLTITAKDGLQLIGCSRGVTHGGQPQLKVGAVTTNPIITVNSFGVGIHNLSINGAGATGGGIKLVSNAGTYDAGSCVISSCFFKNCKNTGAAATGGAIYWGSYGGCWAVHIQNCEFYDCRCGIGDTTPSPDTQIKNVKILNCRFNSTVNTNVDADIYFASGVLGLIVDNCTFATVDVPAYATSPSAARYIKLADGNYGTISRCTFACISDVTAEQKTFGTAGDAIFAPVTVRMAGCWGEGAVATSDLALFGRT